MYKKKIPFDIDCGIKITMEVIGGKWKSCIIQELCAGPKRPSELHRLFPEASPRVINQQLKERNTRYNKKEDIYRTAASFGIFHNRTGKHADPCHRTTGNLGRQFSTGNEEDTGGRRKRFIKKS